MPLRPWWQSATAAKPCESPSVLLPIHAFPVGGAAAHGAPTHQEEGIRSGAFNFAWELRPRHRGRSLIGACLIRLIERVRTDPAIAKQHWSAGGVHPSHNSNPTRAPAGPR